MPRAGVCTAVPSWPRRRAASPPNSPSRSRDPRSSHARRHRLAAGWSLSPSRHMMRDIFGAVEKLLPTTVVGSYPQPDWLVDRQMLGSRPPPRVRALEIWRGAPPLLEQAHDDATIVAIRDMGRARIDIITDGEIRPESYSHRFATAVEGGELDHPGTAL